MKRFTAVVALSAAFCFGMGSSRGVPALEESDAQVSPEIKQMVANEKEVDYNRLANYLNYIQYSTSKIIKSSSKVAIDAERFDILNHIKNESFRNDDLIDAYDNLLHTLTQYEMKNMERESLKLDIQNRRNNAIWQAASSLGNSVIAAGSARAASSLGKSAGAATGWVGAITALAGIIVNTGVNYVRTQHEIANDFLKESLKINSGELTVLRTQQGALYKAQGLIFKNRESDADLSLIKEDPMNQFTDLLVEYDQRNFEEQDQNVFIAKLSDYEKQTWFLFQPYQEFFVKLYSDKYIKSWNACIEQNQNEKKCVSNVDVAALDSAVSHYNDLRFISTKSKVNVFVKQNPIMKNASKKLLQPLLTREKKYAGVIEVVVSELEQSVAKENTMELADSRFLIYMAHLSMGKTEDAKSIFSKLESTGAVKKTDRMYYIHHCNIVNENNDFCKKSTEMWNVLDNLGGEEFREFEQYVCIRFTNESEEKSEEKETPSNVIDRNNLGAQKYLNYGKRAAKFVINGSEKICTGIFNILRDGFEYVIDTPERECYAEIDRATKQNEAPSRISFGSENQVYLNRIYVIDKPTYSFRGHKKIDGEVVNSDVFVNKNDVVFDSLEF